MEIGYACLNIGIINSSYRTFRKNSFNIDSFLDIVGHNLSVLEDTIDYNIKENIKVFRISSDLIPFGNFYREISNWEEKYKTKINRIKKKVKDANIILSMHPGQYTVLNSKDENVVKKSIDDLIYHKDILNLFQTDLNSKIVIHIGGVYGDKLESKKRFIHNFNKLPQSLKDRLVIENDDRSYNIEDILEISAYTNAPVVFDNLHNKVNKSNLDLSEEELINLCSKTWKKKDLPQKIHYSQNDLLKSKTAHSKTIDLNIFNEFIIDNDLINKDINIMLEVKDKNLSCIKCNNLIRKDKDIKFLEKEWARYKYLVLEHDHKSYEKIRKLLKDKDEYPVMEFYDLIDKALNNPITKGSFTNALDHVWGYLKSNATEKEYNKFKMYKCKVLEGKYKINTIKKYILDLSIKYKKDYIIESLYLFM